MRPARRRDDEGERRESDGTHGAYCGALGLWLAVDLLLELVELVNFWLGVVLNFGRVGELICFWYISFVWPPPNYTNHALLGKTVYVLSTDFRLEFALAGSVEFQPGLPKKIHGLPRSLTPQSKGVYPANNPKEFSLLRPYNEWCLFFMCGVPCIHNSRNPSLDWV